MGGTDLELSDHRLPSTRWVGWAHVGEHKRRVSPEMADDGLLLLESEIDTEVTFLSSNWEGNGVCRIQGAK